jgi:Na+-translocating ferredoxin:NAD+ oxidoreductase RnfD subunit
MKTMEATLPEPPRKRGLKLGRGGGSVIGHTGFNVARFHSTHVVAALAPMGAGILFFGWRALFAVGIVLGTVFVGTLFWRKIGIRGHILRPALLIWLGTLLAVMLPASLAGSGHDHRPLWPLLPAAALLLVIWCWCALAPLIGRVHPVVAVYLLLAIGFHSDLAASGVLQRNRVVVGDLLSPNGETRTIAYPLAWRERPVLPGVNVLRRISVPDALTRFTRNEPGRPDSVDALLRDGLPPLEDLVLGATPGGIGTTSTVAILIGGLLLIYRGLVDWRLPVLIAASCWIAVLLLPGHYSSELASRWVWIAGRKPDVGWARAVTLADYELLGTPLLFTAFFLAGSPFVRPLNKWSRSIFAVTTGFLAAIAQLYISAALGSYIAVLLAGLLAPTFDRWFASRSLV